MKTIIFSAILLHLNWCYGLPDPRGVGAYAYQDSLGNRFPSFGPIFGAGGLVPYDIMSQPNSAYASGAIGPGFSHQIAAINPENDAMRNIDITNRFNDAPGNNKFYGVSSSSYSSSSNINGKAQNLRSAETVVNNNGKITKYRVQDP
ncbi:uncharacterized protein LOC123714021 isoform X5 [Pieris brassicae]|uniref:uncharacterized protein LOC123714021 isoform X5 n=1 Tax=Pieris brassicae TaxID=7116 RepID=UPI001E65F370|nr:uncharacterized protein LOC123714021 isoform X5 [Pieris brassicae]